MSETIKKAVNIFHHAFKDRRGEKYTTNEGYEIEIIEYFGALNCTIKFNNGLVIRNIIYDSIKTGNVKNPYHKSVYDIGCIGEGLYTSKVDGKTTNYYSVWCGLIKRGYSKNFKLKHPTYKDVTVCDEWYNFQNFAKWFEENYNPEIMEGWHLDKDILTKGNKVYSPETCCFVPQEINKIFTKTNAKRGDYPIGVRQDKIRENFLSFVQTNKRPIYLGTFDTLEEAFQVYKTAK